MTSFLLSTSPKQRCFAISFNRNGNVVPDGDSSRQAVPSIAYNEQRIVIDWIVPEETTIGNQTLTFTVDPDELVTGDANRSNNQATVDVFVGRA